MKNFWQVFRGILIGLASLALVLGGLSISLAESGANKTPTATHSPTLPPSATPSRRSSPTLTGTVTKTLTFTPSTPTGTLPPPPVNCPPPSGWLPYIVQSGDTLAALADTYRTTTGNLAQANCLQNEALTPGGIIYLPPVPTLTPTRTRIPCGAPASWIVIFVQPGDTLFRISQAYGITVAQLQIANCMGASTGLRTGQALLVPPWAPTPPTPTLPGFQTFVPTDTFVSPGETPTDTVYIIPSNTPPDTPTETPVP